MHLPISGAYSAKSNPMGSPRTEHVYLDMSEGSDFVSRQSRVGLLFGRLLGLGLGLDLGHVGQPWDGCYSSLQLRLLLLLLVLLLKKDNGNPFGRGNNERALEFAGIAPKH